MPSTSTSSSTGTAGLLRSSHPAFQHTVSQTLDMPVQIAGDDRPRRDAGTRPAGGSPRPDRLLQAGRANHAAAAGAKPLTIVYWQAFSNMARLSSSTAFRPARPGENHVVQIQLDLEISDRVHCASHDRRSVHQRRRRPTAHRRSAAHAAVKPQASAAARPRRVRPRGSTPAADCRAFRHHRRCIPTPADPFYRLRNARDLDNEIADPSISTPWPPPAGDTRMPAAKHAT